LDGGDRDIWKTRETDFKRSSFATKALPMPPVAPITTAFAPTPREWRPLLVRM
jgi:hypothetical protein